MALRVIGRSFIALGTLILLFIAYQLVGTNFITGREQKALASQMRQSWSLSSVQDQAPDLGTGIAVIKIPKIGVNAVVVEGVQLEDLKKGPGHYPGTALPGQLGNVAIAGHRTTYGAPFFRLDELAVGDEITLIDAAGTYKYLVSENKVVSPSRVDVIEPTSDARLTLTTCNPKFSARQRLIIVAQLQGTPKPNPSLGRGAGLSTIPGPR